MLYLMESFILQVLKDDRLLSNEIDRHLNLLP